MLLTVSFQKCCYAFKQFINVNHHRYFGSLSPFHHSSTFLFPTIICRKSHLSTLTTNVKSSNDNENILSHTPPPCSTITSPVINQPVQDDSTPNIFEPKQPTNNQRASNDIDRMLSVFKILGGTGSAIPFSLYKWFGRWWWSSLTKWLFNTYHDTPFHLSVEEGANRALYILFEKLSLRDWTSLEQCVDQHLLKKMRQIIEELDGKDNQQHIEMSLQFHSTLKTRLIDLRLIFGGHRTQSTDTLNSIIVPAMTPIGLAHFLLPKKKSLSSINSKQETSSLGFEHNGRSRADILKAAMEQAAIIRIDVVCQSQQQLTLKTNTLLMTTEQPIVFHHLKFEASLKPSSEFTKQYGKPFYDWGDGWTLVDFNNALSGNYPFHPDCFTDRRSIKIIENDITDSPFITPSTTLYQGTTLHQNLTK